MAFLPAAFCCLSCLCDLDTFCWYAERCPVSSFLFSRFDLEEREGERGRKRDGRFGRHVAQEHHVCDARVSMSNEPLRKRKGGGTMRGVLTSSGAVAASSRRVQSSSAVVPRRVNSSTASTMRRSRGIVCLFDGSHDSDTTRPKSQPAHSISLTCCTDGIARSTLGGCAEFGHRAPYIGGNPQRRAHPRRRR